MCLDSLRFVGQVSSWPPPGYWSDVSAVQLALLFCSLRAPAFRGPAESTSLKLAVGELMSVALSFHRTRSLKPVVSELLSVPLGFHRNRSLKWAVSELTPVPLSLPFVRI